MAKKFIFGEGKISGYISIFLSILAFFAIFCFKFPELLTTSDLREIYTAEIMRSVLFTVIIISFLFALLSFILSRKKTLTIISFVILTLTIYFEGLTIQGRAVEKTSWSLGLDWLLIDLLLMSIIFIPFEIVFPKYKDQELFHSEWKTDLIYFVVGHLLIQFLSVAIKIPAQIFFGKLNLEFIQNFIDTLPFFIELILALFIVDLFQYWIHRFYHSFEYTWRFHSIHHSTIHMNWLAGSRIHLLEILVTRSFTFIPIYILNFSPITFNTLIVIIAIHSVFIHSNIKIEFKYLKYIITSPQYHFWHHCIETKYYGKNYAILFPFLDIIFGTFYLPSKNWPSGTGVHNGNYPEGYLKQFIYPFIHNPFKFILKKTETTDR
ncbi:sterol desaturase family protein [Pigmentibacter ruber]